MSDAPERDDASTRERSRASVWMDRGFWALAILAIGYAVWPKSSGPGVGKPAPILELPVVAHPVDVLSRGAPGNATSEVAPGETHRLAADGTKPLLIEAFASWCGACRNSNSHASALREAEARGRIDVVAVSVDDDIESARQARDSWPIPLRVLHDDSGQFSRRFGVRVLPTYILVRPDGVVEDVTVGTPGALALRKWLSSE